MTKQVVDILKRSAQVSLPLRNDENFYDALLISLIDKWFSAKFRSRQIKPAK